MVAVEQVSGAWPPSLAESALARATAGVDVIGRTALSTLVATVAAPRLITSRRAGLDQADFYADLAAAGDARSTFVDPPTADVRARTRRPPSWMGSLGVVDDLRFESPYQPRHPDVDSFHGAKHPNRIARAQHWRHAGGPRPTIFVLHGFAASPGVFNSAFFSLPWFYGNGCDVVLVTLPFHGRRSKGNMLIDGAELFAGGLVRTNEAMLQAVSDIRSLITYVLHKGAPQVGITGLSLGGYLTALTASAEPRLSFAIPNAPFADMQSLVRKWFPAGTALELARRVHGRSRDEMRAAFAVHSPLSYQPAIDHERLFVIGGLGDRLTPPEQARMLWEHWGFCRIHWYPGNHVIHLQRGEYLREFGRFLGRIGFSEPPQAA